MISGVQDEVRAAEIAGRLLGDRIVRVVAGRPGRNNRVYRVETAAGHRYALKFYPRQADDPRDRLGQEFAALAFLHRHGLRCVPGAFASDPANQCAVYDWMDGVPAGDAASDDDIDQLATFLADLHALREADDARDLRDASASFFSAVGAIAQFEARLARLREAAGDDREVVTFLDKALEPAARTAIEQLRRGYARSGLDPAADLLPAQRSLSPSDFGLHNCLRDERGALVFLDFEYFGWDDPVKMLCDTSLHPGSAFSAPARRRLFARLSPLLARTDPAFASRCELLYPLTGAIWCLILLNDFLPERWSRRVMAGEGETQAVVRRRQLEKARRLYSMLGTIRHDLAAA